MDFVQFVLAGYGLYEWRKIALNERNDVRESE